MEKEVRRRFLLPGMINRGDDTLGNDRSFSEYPCRKKGEAVELRRVGQGGVRGGSCLYEEHDFSCWGFS